MAAKKKRKYFYDYSLLFAVIFITGFGMIMMYAASGYSAQSQMNDAMYFLRHQAVFAAGGLVAMLIVSVIDYHLTAIFSKILYIVAWLLIVATMVIGVASHGSARWIRLGGVRFQPSEIMKIAVIVLLSYLITHYGYQINNGRTWWKVALVGIAPGIVVAATNLSTAMIILGITFFMMWIASKKYWPFVLCGVAGVLVYIFAYPMAKLLSALNILQDYQLTRIFAWKDPASYADETFQTLQGLYAIGSGGLLGKGLGQSIQKLSFLPEPQNDMIFAVICEELGLFGAVAVIFMFLFMLYRFLVIAGNAPDLFGAMLVTGVLAHIAIQVVLNIAVVTNVIPNTGITLPFISYGGTSVLFLMIEMGMVLSVSNQIRLEQQ